VKRALAGSTVSQMGFMIMSCGLGAYAAALWHMVAHGLFKAWLFLGSGSTIGMKAGKPPALSGSACLVIAAGTIGVALTILSIGDADVSLVPLLLGLATAAATLVAALGGKVPMRAKGMLLLTLVGLVAFHSAGLALAGVAVGAHGAPLVPKRVLLALLTVFLGAWVWQQHRAATGRGLPLPLYVHLINAGSLPGAGKGEA
jgi:NADH:ubiquinone oxidoreductase subunit 5 (subunit L)/multisubunit Na+/H+ antiporter MnhA subunit